MHFGKKKKGDKLMYQTVSSFLQFFKTIKNIFSIKTNTLFSSLYEKLNKKLHNIINIGVKKEHSYSVQRVFCLFS